MATRKKCSECGETKSISQFPTTTSSTCDACTHKPKWQEQLATEAELPSSVEETTSCDEEQPVNHFPQVEIDPTNPTHQELARRYACSKSLMQFIKRFRPRYMAGWVHEDICRRLERFMLQVERGESPRLLLMMPVRHGKSEICSRHFPPFLLGHHPDWEIIAASAAKDLAVSFSRYIRDVMRDQSYNGVFPASSLEPNSQSVENWNTTSGGGYLAAGIGSMITGRGAHVLIIDDPVKDAEAANSQVIRDGVWEWYMSTAYTRLAPGGGVLGIMTWWNDDDWAGRIQQVMATGDGDVFEIVKYPAVNDHGDEYLLTDDSIAQFPPGSDVPDGATLIRPKDTALHGARYTYEALRRIRANYYALGQQRWWAALFQQNPTPDEGAYFTKDMFRFYASPPRKHDRVIYQAWDFAITEKTMADYTVCATIAQDNDDNIYVLDITRFRSNDSFVIADAILDQYQTQGANIIGFEDSQIWRAIEAVFAKRCRERHLYPVYEVLKPFTDKIVRAQPLKGRMQGGKVFFPEKAPWYSDMQTEFLRFPTGKHDDMVDALSWAMRMVLSKNAPRARKPQHLKSWKEKLPQLMIGGEGGHMSA